VTTGHRSRRSRSARALITMVVAAFWLVAVLLPSAAATAQPATTVPVGSPPAADPDPLNAGGVVFLGVSAVLFGGALLLYLRHRPRARS
jgi:hypothetical protein